MSLKAKAKPVKKAVLSKIPKKKRITILSRHPSHNILRDKLSRMPFKGLVRLGSTTPTSAKLKALYGDKIAELNSIESIKNSASKIRMKNCFEKAGVISAEDMKEGLILNWAKDRLPIVAKSEFGSRGKGNTLIKTIEELNTWVKGKNISNYVFEKYYSYNREYRLHVTKDGCFYTCRKMLKSDTPEKDRWFKNDSNSSWILETNELFDKPVNWKSIESECVKALLAVGLHIGACDVRVQSTLDGKGRARKEPLFIVIEINSAPSLGEITAQKYLEKIPEVLNQTKEESK